MSTLSSPRILLGMTEIASRIRLLMVPRALRLAVLGLVVASTTVACISADGVVAPPECEDEILTPPTDTSVQEDTLRPNPPSNPTPDVTPCPPDNQ
jgi:hypothetical protein